MFNKDREWKVVAAGSNPELLKELKDSNNSAYKEWQKKGSPVGNAGIFIEQRGKTFRIKPYRQWCLIV